jgi:predicted amidohydrolase YtcJ
MIFQQTFTEGSSMVRTRAAAFFTAAFESAYSRLTASAKRAGGFQAAISSFTVASRALNKVARRHALRLVKENSAIARAAGKDIGTIARTTVASLTRKKAPAPGRKPRIAKARTRRSAKAA